MSTVNNRYSIEPTQRAQSLDKSPNTVQLYVTCRSVKNANTTLKPPPPRSALTDEDWGTLLLQRRRFESDYALFNDSRKLYNRKAECNVSIVRPLGYSTSHARPYTDASRPFFVPYRLSWPPSAPPHVKGEREIQINGHLSNDNVWSGPVCIMAIWFGGRSSWHGNGWGM